MDISRRGLLKGGVLAGLFSFAWAGDLEAFAREIAQPDIQFPAKPADRLALISWPFRQYMESPYNKARNPKKPGMNIVQFARMAIEKFGIHNINPMSSHFGSWEPGYLEQTREAVEKAGSRFVNLSLGGATFWDPDPAKRQAAIGYGRQWIDRAIILGSPAVRPHLAGASGVKPNADLAAQSLSELADYGAKKNVVVDLENDDLVNEDPFFLVKVIEKAGNPYLRALPDFGNTLARGNADYNYRGLKAMFQHAYNMSHVKDEITSDAGKVYKVDLAKVFGIARASGYRGYFSMEFDTPDPKADPFAGTRRLVRETLRYQSVWAELQKETAVSAG